MNWLWFVLVLALIYIGVDYGRLVHQSKQYQNIQFTSDMPLRHIMVKTDVGHYIYDLIKMDLDAHRKANIDIKIYDEKSEPGILKIVFDNKDELIVYDYEKAQIVPLTQDEIKDYAHKLFFDYRLPQGAERAIIEKLGLLNYMVNIGICNEKNGGK